MPEKRVTLHPLTYVQEMQLGQLLLEIIWLVIWVICLIISIHIAWFCAVIYVLVQPLAVWCDALQELSESINKVVHLPRLMAKNIQERKTSC